MATYKFRFWYCHQEVVITGITADELVQSLFFPESLEMKDFYRTAYLEGENGPFSIEVTIHDLEHLTIYHMKKEDPESLDVHFGETLHKPLIIKIDFTIKRTTIIAMLQHLIVFLAIFRFRPNTSQTEKTSLTLFCRKFWLFVFGHNQLVGQPLTVALRERKPLQICPQIV